MDEVVQATSKEKKTRAVRSTCDLVICLACSVAVARLESGVAIQPGPTIKLLEKVQGVFTSIWR